MIKRWGARLGFQVWMVVIVLWLVFPFYYAVMTSLENDEEVFQPGLWPPAMDWHNYVDLFVHDYFAVGLINSILIATLVVFISVLVGVMASYALGRVDFRGRKTLLVCVLTVSMFPQIAVLSGAYQMFVSVREILQGTFGIEWNHGLSITWLAFTYLLFTLPFSIWTLTTYMRALPQELEEAALVEGAGFGTIIWRIYMPNLQPALITTALMSFIAAWNEFLFALTFTTQQSERPLTVAISMISGTVDFQLPWGTIMAAAVVATLPVIALVIVFQRRLVSGLTSGAIKG